MYGQNFQTNHIVAAQMQPVYYIKNGAYVTCSADIHELVNGNQSVRKCGVHLTNYGDKRDTDRVPGRNQCYSCYRKIHRERGKEKRENSKKLLEMGNLSQMPMQTQYIQSGMLPLTYQQNQVDGRTFDEKYGQSPYFSYATYAQQNTSDNAVEHTSDEDSNDDSQLKEEIKSLKSDLELQKETNKRIVDENKILCEQNRTLAEKLERLQSDFEDMVMKVTPVCRAYEESLKARKQSI